MIDDEREREREREADAEARRLMIAAWTTEPRPGHEERLLDAIDAAEAKRLQAAARAGATVTPMAPVVRATTSPRRRPWQPVAVVLVALAAAALLALHYRERPHPLSPHTLLPAGPEWTPEPATAVPPHRHDLQAPPNDLQAPPKDR